MKPETFRYVVLFHTGGTGGDHFDLMIEMPRAVGLKTWRIAQPPEDWGKGVTAEPIGDHRKAYLIYEGEISGDRGHVTRIAQGNATLQPANAGILRVRLDGGILCELELPDA